MFEIRLQITLLIILNPYRFLIYNEHHVFLRLVSVDHFACKYDQDGHRLKYNLIITPYVNTCTCVCVREVILSEMFKILT